MSTCALCSMYLHLQLQHLFIILNFHKFHWFQCLSLSQVLPLYLVTSFLLDSSSSTVPVPVLVPALGSSFSRCPAHVAALESHNPVAPQGDQPWNHHGHQYNWIKSLPRNKLVEKLVTDVTVTHGGQDFQSNPVWNGDFVCCPFHLAPDERFGMIKTSAWMYRKPVVADLLEGWNGCENRSTSGFWGSSSTDTQIRLKKNESIISSTHGCFQYLDPLHLLLSSWYTETVEKISNVVTWLHRVLRAWRWRCLWEASYVRPLELKIS